MFGEATQVHPRVGAATKEPRGQLQGRILANGAVRDVILDDRNLPLPLLDTRRGLTLFHNGHTCASTFNLEPKPINGGRPGARESRTPSYDGCDRLALRCRRCG